MGRRERENGESNDLMDSGQIKYSKTGTKASTITSDRFEENMFKAWNSPYVLKEKSKNEAIFNLPLGNQEKSKKKRRRSLKLHSPS